jgi:predicted transposase YdaD
MAAEKGEASAEPKSTRAERTVGRDTGAIPASQFGRVRALASYGMTQAQVAELYGVGVDEIERIIRQSNSTRIA